jgi:hypothetical protein
MTKDQKLHTSFEASLDRKTVLVDEDLLLQAQSFIAGCENCAASAVQPMTFEYVLDAITACDSTATDYLLCRPAECPCCSAAIVETTLVLTH